MREIGEREFNRRYQCPPRSLKAFEKSEYPDDWRELMRLYLVRRTRSFIQDHYAETDRATGQRYLEFANGKRAYFPQRIPKTLRFTINDKDPNDQYARMYRNEIVDTINQLRLPRYGIGNYQKPRPEPAPTAREAEKLGDLSRAGRRLAGFCRTNLFKRLESSGQAFQLSLVRHLLRNYIFLHALENDLEIPIGTQHAELLDTRLHDADSDNPSLISDEYDEFEAIDGGDDTPGQNGYQARASLIHRTYQTRFKNRFRWLRASLFAEELVEDLRADNRLLHRILDQCGPWQPAYDTKLQALLHLLETQLPDSKVLLFSQFADTVDYLYSEITTRGITAIAAATGDVENPTRLAQRFSPVSNDLVDRIRPGESLRVLLATDVLSEGQNLQDAHVVVNYDLPWAIIRLIQRAGRVDRIGQQSNHILCYSFLPAEGVERVINLRGRLSQRLQQSREVVGSDEAFFEGEADEHTLLNLYNETAGILDDEGDSEVDLASQALAIWQDALDGDPGLEQIVPELPPVVYSTMPHAPSEQRPEGAIVYLKTPQDNDALAYVDANGKSITESQFEILQLARCQPGTPALPRQDNHHAMVAAAIRHIAEEDKHIGGQLGRPSGARYRTYDRLKAYADNIKGELFDSDALARSVDEIYRNPLTQHAIDILNRQLRAGIEDQQLAELVINLREEDRLCIVRDEDETRKEPQIICSLGLSNQ